MTVIVSNCPCTCGPAACASVVSIVLYYDSQTAVFTSPTRLTIDPDDWAANALYARVTDSEGNVYNIPLGDHTAPFANKVIMDSYTFSLTGTTLPICANQRVWTFAGGTFSSVDPTGFPWVYEYSPGFFYPATGNTGGLWTSSAL